MPIQEMRSTGQLWVPHQYGGNTSIPAGRGSLIAGVHKPDAANTGPYTVTTWIDVFPAGGSNEITVTTNQYGKRFWACVKANDGVRFDECFFVGPDPDTYGDGFATQNKGCLQNFGSGVRPQWEVWDSIIDPMPWVTMQGRASLNPHSFGIHGSNISLYRTEIVNVGDGWNFVGPNGSDPQAVLDQYSLLQQCWMHKGYYANDVRSISDGQIHCDGFQTNYGRNIDIIGNTIGGDRDAVGYNTWPGWPASNGPGYNSGDDFCYSALMLTQEVPPDANSIITNLLIQDNWLGGGTATMNMPVERGCDHSGTTVDGNRFLTRGADWGRTLAANSPGWVPYQRNTGAGVYFAKGAGLAATFTGNVYEETGLPLPGGG